jgi:hypothetical protein
MKTVPLVKPATGSALTAALGTAPTNVADEQFVAQLFGMECRASWMNPDPYDYCPPGTPAPPASGSDPYKFTMLTLIGMIFHAQGYTELVPSCSDDSTGYSPKTVTAASYAAGSSDPSANPTRFLLDQYGTYTCREDAPFPCTTRVGSAVADGSYQTMLTTRYKCDAGGGPQTDFFQVDVSDAGTTPSFLALNDAGTGSRILLLANLANHRFAIKYLEPAAGKWGVAVGVGGYDLTTGTPNAGHYWVTDHLGFPDLCADNAAGTFVDVGACAADGVPVAWTTVEALQAYLEVPAAHAARLAPYLAKFATAERLPASEAYAAAGDEDLYFPATLH